jgi:hypothetical protein
VAGLETIVCLRYAARAIEAAGPRAAELEAELRQRLATAPSNDPAKGTGREVYDAALPAFPAVVRAAAAYAALAALAPQRLRPVVGPFLIESREPGCLQVQHRRTGQSWALGTAVERPTPVSAAVTVILAERRVELGLPELPEQEREELRRALRQELRSGVLSREEEAQIADGLVTYRRAIGDALIRQLPADPAAAAGVDLERLGRTLDLLALEERAVPFDAQTRYFRLLTQGPPETRRPLRSFAERFGFALPSGSDSGR